jgi:hypothetical protein
LRIQKNENAIFVLSYSKTGKTTMSVAEQELLEKWRDLRRDQQQQVLEFVEFVHLKHSAKKIPLGERLRQIREKIVASGKPLLDEEEIAKELASLRGGLQGK